MERAGTTGRAVRLAIPVGVGLLTGVLTLVAQSVLPEAFNRLANSGAVWVTVAFVVGTRMESWRAAAVAGLVTLLFAVGGYYAAAGVAGAGVSMGAVAIWSGTAVVGGPVFGAAGWAWWSERLHPGRRHAVAAALLGAVYLAEGIYTLLLVPAMAPAGLAEVIAGIVLAAVLPRDGATRRLAVVVLVPLTLVGLAGFLVIDRLFLLR